MSKPVGEDAETTTLDMGIGSDKPPTQGHACLVALAGEQVGRVIKLEASTVLGRGSSADVSLNGDGISRRHALLTISEKGAVIEDLKSVNGTWVNGQRVLSCELQNGDKIRLGAATILKFSYRDSVEETFHREMYQAAVRDPLTKTFNRRYFLDKLQEALDYASMHQKRVAVLMFDIDRFKSVNDTYGHAAGDAVLVSLTGLVGQIIRSDDVCARLGGEEFAVLASGLALGPASVLGLRICSSVHAHRFVWEGTTMPVTVSVGVASYPELPLSTPEAMLECADRALYEAKEAGRNRVALGRQK